MTIANVGGSGAAATPATGGAPLAALVLEDAQSWVNEGVPYLWGGISRFGADCSGYVKQVFAENGIEIAGRTSEEQATEGLPVASLAAAQPGAVLFYNYEGLNSHEALYAGNGLQYAETSPGHPATLQPVDTAHLDAIREFITPAGQPAGNGVTAGAPAAGGQWAALPASVTSGQAQLTSSLGGLGGAIAGALPFPLNAAASPSSWLGGLVTPIESWLLRVVLGLCGVALVFMALIMAGRHSDVGRAAEDDAALGAVAA